MWLSWQNSMHRDPLQTLVHLVATEPNPHELILRVTADSRLLKEMQRLCRKLPDAAGGDGHVEPVYVDSTLSYPEAFLVGMPWVDNVGRVEGGSTPFIYY